MTHELQPLPYALNALEPVISAETLGLHHDKHHRAYVDKLNKLIVGTEFEDASLDEIVRRAKGQIFDQAGQVWNHDFYWRSMTPRAERESERPGGELARHVEIEFGSFERFREVFTKAAAGVFGSGWAWLTWNPKDERLFVETTPNGENPIREGHIPLLTCDVWEHAYYVDYRNERPKYLEGFWKVANWRFAEENFESARGTSTQAA